MWWAAVFTFRSNASVVWPQKPHDHVSVCICVSLVWVCTSGLCCCRLTSSLWYRSAALGYTSGSWASGFISSSTVFSGTPSRMAALMRSTAFNTAHGTWNVTREIQGTEKLYEKCWKRSEIMLNFRFVLVNHVNPESKYWTLSRLNSALSCKLSL